MTTINHSEYFLNATGKANPHPSGVATLLLNFVYCHGRKCKIHLAEVNMCDISSFYIVYICLAIIDFVFFLIEIRHLFHDEENDWGFGNFMIWENVLNPEMGYIKDDSITLEVCIYYIHIGIPSLSLSKLFPSTCITANTVYVYMCGYNFISKAVYVGFMFFSFCRSYIFLLQYN